jgi:hypothetical protein
MLLLSSVVVESIILVVRLSDIACKFVEYFSVILAAHIMGTAIRYVRTGYTVITFSFSVLSAELYVCAAILLYFFKEDRRAHTGIAFR